MIGMDVSEAVMAMNRFPNPNESRSLSVSERNRIAAEVLAMPLGNPLRREWLTVLATAYPSWNRMANDPHNRPTLRGMGDPLSEALADEYDAYHASRRSF
jgi:hypothetical protein